MKLGKFFIVVIFLLILSAWSTSNSYLNKYSGLVAITTKSGNALFGKTDENKVFLNNGDLYEECDGCGYIYERYGFIDDIARSFIKENIEPSRTPYKNVNKELEKQYDDFQSVISSKKLPDNWVDNPEGRYQSIKEGLLKEIDHLKVSENSKADDKIKQLKAEYAFYTNRYSDSKIFEKLSDGDFDLDKDGLTNLEEFYCQSDPLVRSGLVVSPAFYKFTPNDSLIYTGKFSVANLTNTNRIYSIYSRYQSSDNRYAPKIVPLNSKFCVDKNGYMVFNISPKSKQYFLYLLNAKYLPYCFGNLYCVSVRIKNDLGFMGTDLGNVVFYMFGNKGPEISKTDNLYPKCGAKLQPENNTLSFRWKSGERNISKNREEEIRYVIQFYNVNKKMAFDYFCFTNKFFAPAKNDLNTFSPGIYFWRIIKQDAFSAPACSDWNWFAIGKKAEEGCSNTLEKGKRLIPEKKYNCGIAYYDMYKGIPFDFDICPLKASENQPFIYKLPKDFECYFDDNYWHLKGTPHEVGRWTNIWFRIRPDMVWTNICVFSVYDPAEEILSRSFYDLGKKAVVHDLTVDYRFEYPLQSYFDILSKTSDTALTKDYSVKISPDLPDGLTLLFEDGRYIISGTPKNVGEFIAEITYEKDNKLKEKHIFNIRTGKNPKPLTFAEEWNVVYLSEEPWGHYQYFMVGFKKGIVRHILSNEKSVRYPLSLDYLAYGRKRIMLDSYETSFGQKRRAYKRHDENQQEVELLSPLPNGIRLEENDGKFYLECELRSVGAFTNLIKIVSQDGVYTNMHIFRVEKVKTP